jgi:hypothetical protein
MVKYQLNTPVAFIIFNRPNLTEKVFCQIRNARPPKLFVIADGPRNGFPDDKYKCRATRDIIETVDWPCEVFRNYSDINLGCGVRIATGISWLFECVEEAIILEDDCVPDLSFFLYCAELLERYRLDERVMHISGNNCAIKSKDSNKKSYYFSRIPHCWGWATWRRAWRCFDFEIKALPEVLSTKKLAKIWPSSKAQRFWEDLFIGLYYNKMKNVWAYQWTFACQINNGLSINPNVTLVSNIGFTNDATHTKNSNHPLANIKTNKMGFPLNHPELIACNEEADEIMLRKVFEINIFNDLLRILKFFFRGGFEAS